MTETGLPPDFPPEFRVWDASEGTGDEKPTGTEPPEPLDAPPPLMLAKPDETPRDSSLATKAILFGIAATSVTMLGLAGVSVPVLAVAGAMMLRAAFVLSR